MTTYLEVKEILKENIIDFQEVNLDFGVKRKLEVDCLDKKATICIGLKIVTFYLV